MQRRSVQDRRAAKGGLLPETCMPRFYFDLDASDLDGAGAVDKAGTEFPDVEAARRAALQFLPDYAGDRLRSHMDYQSLHLHVRDESGQAVYRVRLVMQAELPNVGLS